MSIKDQLLKIKDNWLLVLVLLVVIALLLGGGSFTTKLTNSSFIYDRMATDESMVLATGKGGGGMMMPSYEQGFAPEVEDRKIVKTASLSTEVDRGEFQDSVTKLNNIIDSSDAYLLSENIGTNGTGFKEYYIGSFQIKVELDKYDSVVSQLKEIGEVQFFDENADDVTGSYTNLEIELELERERLTRYQVLYNEAKDVNDKLNLNDRIFNQERTIKYYEERLANLDAKIDYSTIYVTITEERSKFFEASFVKLSNLARAFVSSINSILVIVITLIPYLVVLGLLYAIIRWVRKRR
ncbi:MAG: DUF4349 domain-containing protein [Candidatus Komeilibacteria bacterium]